MGLSDVITEGRVTMDSRKGVRKGGKQREGDRSRVPGRRAEIEEWWGGTLVFSIHGQAAPSA